MNPAEQRIVAKQYGRADRVGQWGIYDRARGSWPMNVPGFGPVPDSFPNEAAAVRAAADLESFYANVPVAP